MEMRLDYAAPAADVAAFAASFYDLTADGSAPDHSEGAQIRFRLNAQPCGYRLHGDIVRPAARIHVVAASDTTPGLCADAPVAMFGITFTPAGWAAAIGGDPTLMVNWVIDATVLFGPGIRPALTALRAAPDLAARVAIGDTVVRALVRTTDGGARVFVRQVYAWLTESPSPDMAALADLTGLSRRQIERKCKALYGVPPKLLARKDRALRAAAAIRAGNEPLGTVIARGFYDQSHMIREIKQFTGMTPGQIRADPLAPPSPAR